MSTRLIYATRALAYSCICMLFLPPDASGTEHKIANQAPPEDIRISELMYHPLDVNTLNGDSLEFIELWNSGSSPVNLGGVAFVDGIRYAFASGDVLEAGAFLVLAGNADAFENHYGFAPFGDYDGRLDNSGEQITLNDGSGNGLVQFTYGDRYPWPIGPDGAGFSLLPVNKDAGLDLSDPGNWRASRMGGSPGEDDMMQEEAVAVQINEVLTHTDLPFKDAVELFNPTGEAVDLGGWYLTDEKETPRKFKIPANTSIPAQGYLVFDEDDFNPVPDAQSSFGLSSQGDAIYLFATDDQDNLTGYVRGFVFGGADNGVSFGREEWATGEEELLPQQSETLGRANSGARIGPVVISELMYGPTIGEEEFVELVNISSQTVSLFDQQFPENTWKIEGIGFSFPQNAELGPMSIALVVPVAPEVFRAARGIPAQVAIYGPYTGKLNNAGEAIQLQAPDDPDLDGTVPYFDMDQVIYSDTAPWPVSADAGGASLLKINLDGLSNDPASWTGLPNNGSPGYVDLGSVSTEQPVFASTGMQVAPVFPNPFEQSATVSFESEVAGQVRVRIFDILGREVRVVFDNVVPAGASQDVQIDRADLPAGTYFIQVEQRGLKSTVLPVVVR